MNPGLVHRESLIRAILASRRIREAAQALKDFQGRPTELKKLMRRQSYAAKKRHEKARQQLAVYHEKVDQFMAVVREYRRLELELRHWEVDEQKLKEKFLRECAKVRSRLASAQLNEVRKVKLALGGRLLGGVQRIPELRRPRLARRWPLPIREFPEAPASTPPPSRSAWLTAPSAPTSTIPPS